MISIHDFKSDRGCDHCHKNKLGSFGATVNKRRLFLCYKCLANQANIFGEQEEEPDLFARRGNGNAVAS